MTAEYTPTIDQICNAYVAGGDSATPADSDTWEEREANFWRGIAAHDAKVAAKALREVADITDAYASGRVAADALAAGLRIRADRIGGGR